MYSPFIGRFAERDPVEADPNLYRYCYDMPTRATDSSGRIIDDLVAEAIKALLEFHHNHEGKDTLTKSSEKGVNSAILELIKSDFLAGQKDAYIIAQRNGAYYSNTIDIPSAVEKNGLTVPEARLYAGRLGFNRDIVDDDLAHVQAESQAGNLVVQVGNTTVPVIVSQTGDKGELFYKAFWDPRAKKFCSVFWQYTYSYWFSGRRKDNGEGIRVNVPVFKKADSAPLE